MSRSKKKHNIGGITTAASEKDDKKLWHKIFRRKNKTLLNSADKADETVFITENGVMTPWQMSKDGKSIRTSEKEKRK